ncbi:protocadherin-10-like [Nematolebias whitei]|uniref:protocadherin-10-like n=1 Tax=Nematolebias whitei TaxID=451745 RepID=UPI00189A241F|nr:protocadherin-10-like [Nematolebias whitei]
MAPRIKYVNTRSLLLALLCLSAWTAAQISYTVSEEADKGAAVGNLAKDLNLSVQQLHSTTLHITSGYKKQYFDINHESGVLFVSDRIDREELCPNVVKCSLNIEATVNHPRSLHRIEVLINDINDNAPTFLEDIITVDMFESSYVGEKHPLPVAYDADEGSNSIRTYKLNPNEYFSLDVQNTGDQSVSAELVLQKVLDRETEAVIELVLTAVDGGTPPKTGTLQIKVNVLDVNDNPPLFSKPLYKVQVMENANIGAVLLTLTATDSDEGVNGQIEYYFTERARLNHLETFSINNNSGEITVKGTIDYEENQAFELRVQARDKGTPPRSAHCKVLVEVLDANDNAPEISVSSLMSPVKENAEIGTAVAMVTITDKDGGKNGFTICKIKDSVPFKLKSNYKNYYSILVDGPLDREHVSSYEIHVEAKDEGTPALSSSAKITIQISDVNDNPPQFTDSLISVYVKENSQTGTTIHKLTTTDLDLGENAKSIYRLINGSPKSPQITVNSETGDIVSLQSFNHEELKTFQFQIASSHSGSTWWVVIIGALYLLKEPSVLWHLTAIKLRRLSRKITDTDTMAIRRYRLRSEKLSSFIGTHVPIKEDSFSDLNLHLLIAIVSVSVIFLLSLISLIAVRCHRTDGSFSRYSAPMITTHPDGSWSYSKAAQQYDVCFSSDTLKSDVVVFPAACPPVDAELISINGGDTFTRTQTLPNSDKVRIYFNFCDLFLRL